MHAISKECQIAFRYIGKIKCASLNFFSAILFRLNIYFQASEIKKLFCQYFNLMPWRHGPLTIIQRNHTVQQHIFIARDNHAEVQRFFVWKIFVILDAVESI
ncbi:hypothetical protein D3C81_2033500 [compost metagenome]